MNIVMLLFIIAKIQLMKLYFNLKHIIIFGYRAKVVVTNLTRTRSAP